MKILCESGSGKSNSKNLCGTSLAIREACEEFRNHKCGAWQTKQNPGANTGILEILPRPLLAHRGRNAGAAGLFLQILELALGVVEFLLLVGHLIFELCVFLVPCHGIT